MFVKYAGRLADRLTIACAALLAMLVVGVPHSARAQTLPEALALAYMNNPQLNSQRAILRQNDENVPQALSGYRPSLTAQATLGEQYLSTTATALNGGGTASGNNTPHSFQLQGTQTVYNGNITANTVRQAESQVSAASETLRLTTQQVLLDSATSYMNLLRDSALFDLQRRNVEVLQEQLRQTRDRFSVGEVTRTDVAQSESRLAAGRSQLLSAQSNYTTSRSEFRRIIGVDPGRLTPGTPVDRFSPPTLDAAQAVGIAENPNVTAAMYGVDVQLLQVKINEGALYPSVQLQGTLNKSYESSLQLAETGTASILGIATWKLYQGGAEYATIRRSKEFLGQKRLDLDTQRDQVRGNVVSAWGQLQAAKAQIQSSQAQVTASEIALNGVREEARVGQRTTLDVLNAQQELVNARSALVTAQRDRVVASYTLLFAVGRLRPQVLGLAVEIYDGRTHYYQVRDNWVGVRTPDGR